MMCEDVDNDQLMRLLEVLHKLEAHNDNYHEDQHQRNGQ